MPWWQVRQLERPGIGQLVRGEGGGGLVEAAGRVEAPAGVLRDVRGAGQVVLSPGVQAGDPAPGEGVRGRVAVEQVGEGQARPGRCPVAPVEGGQRRCNPVAETLADLPRQVRSRPGGAEALTFDIEKGEFVEGIDSSQRRAEFQAVDDRQWGAEPDVLRPEVAVTVDDAAAGNAIDEEIGALAEEATLGAVDARPLAEVELQPPIRKHRAVCGKLAAPVGEERLRVDQARPGVAIETGEDCRQTVKMGPVERAIEQDVLEHLALVEPAHDHQKVHDAAGAADRQPGVGRYQRNDVDVDTRRQSAIEPQLGPAGRFAAVARREVEVGKADRLFQLVDEAVADEDPRHVGLAARYVPGPGRIGRRIGEERNLLLKPDLLGSRSINPHDIPGI